MNIGKAYSLTDFGVESSDFWQHSGPLSKPCSQSWSPYLPTMYPGGLKTLKNNLVPFKWGEIARNRQLSEIGPWSQTLTYFLSYVRLNTKHKLLKDPNSSGTQKQPKPSALQNIFSKMLNIIARPLLGGAWAWETNILIDVYFPCLTSAINIYIYIGNSHLWGL